MSDYNWIFCSGDPYVIPLGDDERRFFVVDQSCPVLIVLVGLPGTGKSTFRSELRATSFNFHEISSDDYIDAEANLNGKTYNEIFKDAVGAANTYVEVTSRNAFLARHNVVWDQTNLNIGKRKKILDKFRNYAKIAIVFGIPDDWDNRLRNRAMTEGKSIPTFIIEEMKKNFVTPSISEGFDIVTTPEQFISSLNIATAA